MIEDIKIRPDENIEDGVVLCNLETAKILIVMCGVEMADLTIGKR
jgi:hypothetical protein